MLRQWNQFVHPKNIPSRILVRGVGLTLIPLSVAMLVVWIVNAAATSIALQGCYRMADQNLNRTVSSLLGSASQYQEHIASSLAGARAVVKRAGEVGFETSRSITWRTENQFTRETGQVALPLMKIGPTGFTPSRDPAAVAPIVDEIQELYGTSATVFQRMNAAGDMLRVATTVKNVDGTRAIGTYIPSAGADGKPNPVLGKVLKGESYLGRAFVVNAWYMAAYEPLTDRAGSVVGMIYTGLPESQAKERILDFNKKLSAAGKSDIFVLHAEGKSQGVFLVSPDKTLQDRSAWDFRDAKGDLYVQEICRHALKMQPGEISQVSYVSIARDGKPPEKTLARYTYFPAWDWVIGVEQSEGDFMGLANQIRRVFRISNFVPILLAVVATVVALSIFKRLTAQMTERVRQVMDALEGSSAKFGQALDEIRSHADSVGASAEQLYRSTAVQATAAEETSATTSSVTETARQNSETAERMRDLSASAETIIHDAKTTLLDVNTAMQSIVDTTDKALTIIDSINEISFATNIVALNASVEAAKAGEAGRTFSFIAAEVRELAQKAAAASQETRIVINNSRAKVHIGTDHVTQLATALLPMDENADQVRKLAVAVTATSQQQAESMQQVLQAIENMQQTSEQSAQAAEQGTRDAGELREQVASLAASVASVDQAIGLLHQEFFRA